MLNQPSQNWDWTNNLRVVATIAVIFLHSASGILGQYGKVSEQVWWTANVYDGLVRFCVPVFVMLTGALLLPKKYELNDFLKKRFSRIVMPFLFWNLIYILFALYQKQSSDQQLSFSEIFGWIYQHYKTPSFLHFWYIYMIIGIYLFIPIISKWVQHCKEHEIVYFLCVWFFVLLINQPVFKKWKPEIDFTYFVGYLGYLVLGYYLSLKAELWHRKKAMIYAAFAFLAGVSITILGTAFLTYKSGSFVEYFYGYLTPNVLLAAVGVFVFLKLYIVRSASVKKVINIISKYSYGIYLAHILLLRFITNHIVDFNLIHPVAAIPLATIACLLSALIVVALINKLHFGKFVSG